ncbi:orotidine-5'-phosphate decarboxylase [Brachybacterium phenoliresistens]|uniref:Orotidine 5'-phosphate decarboxylase n=1 Tax=Brachybacterium phenoliresistens TaxID=396014 RepID=Z9JXV5_9MICO|nr:orotidine-5'-phosphate decarboxylase [Brachybacterium phenoliresistens]EWS82843.1 orotidine 5'-phosphate decarboxylase [Brachybacterium phenoliresistens]
MSTAFGARLQQSVREHGPILAGIDPHGPLLASWGLSDDAAGVREFSRRALEAVAGEVAAIKPQSAFFERHGSAGVAALEELLAAARERGVLTILDVKRGDIGSTMGAYADAYLRPGSSLEADAVTLSPYLGYGSLAPALEHVHGAGKGVFVLALTSNPEGHEVQHARDAAGLSVAAAMAEHVRAENSAAPAGTWGSAGLVVGATVGAAVRELGIDLAATRAPLLVPGFGAQGAGPADLPEVFGAASSQVLVSLSRGLLSAGGEVEALRSRARALRAAYTAAQGAVGGA